MRRTLAVAAVALSAFLLVGCTASGETSGSLPGVGADAPTSRDGGVAPEIAGGGAQGASEDSDVTTENRDVITTGSVSLSVTDPITAAEEAETITVRAGGRIDSRTENPKTPNQPAGADLTLRIPANALDEALDQLRELGTVNFVSLNASDVSQQTQDLDARITSLRTSVDRLLGLMTQATTTTDLIAIETALSTRQSELESLRSQRDYLSDQIDYATITLELHPVGTVAPGAPESFWPAIVAGWNALVTALGAVVVAIGFALPWVLALGIAALVVLLALRIARRKRRGTPTTPQPAAPTTL